MLKRTAKFWRRDIEFVFDRSKDILNQVEKHNLGNAKEQLKDLRDAIKHLLFKYGEVEEVKHYYGIDW